MLIRDHRVIERILPVLEEAALRLEKGRSLDPDIFPGIIEFLEVFADRCHHALEESELFPALGEAGVDTERGLVADLTQEHKAMRILVGKMATLWKDFSEEEAGTRIGASVRVFARILPMHIEKEDRICFPMADDALSAEQQELLQASHEEIVSREPCRGAYDRYRAMIGELEERLEID